MSEEAGVKTGRVWHPFRRVQACPGLACTDQQHRLDTPAASLSHTPSTSFVHTSTAAAVTPPSLATPSAGAHRTKRAAPRANPRARHDNVHRVCARAELRCHAPMISMSMAASRGRGGSTQGRESLRAPEPVSSDCPLPGTPASCRPCVAAATAQTVQGLGVGV